MSIQHAEKNIDKHDNIYSNPVLVAPVSMSDGPSRVDEATEKITRDSEKSEKGVMDVKSKSSVTGGPPEDINMMPPATDTSDPDEVIYDGSALEKSKHPTPRQKRR